MRSIFSVVSKFGIFGIMLLTLWRCSYEPDGSYVNPNIYRPPDTIPVSVDVESIGGSYFLIYPTTFRVSLDLAGKKLVSSKVTGVQNTVTYVSETSFFVMIDPQYVPDGENDVTIEIVTNSGSGSLAESAGLEHYLISKTFSVTVDRTEPQPTNQLSAQLVAGYMRVSWTPTTANNFRYQIIKQTTANKQTTYDFFYYIPAAESSFIDSSYVGGKVNYTIVKESFSFNVPSDTVGYNLNPIVVKASVLDHGKVQFKWQTNAQLDKAIITVSGKNSSSNFEYSNADAIVDTLYLGDTTNYVIAVQRERFKRNAFTQKIALYGGKKIRPFDSSAPASLSGNDIITSKGNIYVAGFAYTTLYKYHAADLSLIDSLRYQSFQYGKVLVSSNGIYGCVQDGQGLLYGASFDPRDFTKPVSKFNLYTIIQNKYNTEVKYPLDFSLSDDNMMIFTGQFFGASNVVTIDLNTQSVWGNLVEGGRASISPDGQYLAVSSENAQNGKIFKRGASTWDTYATVDAAGASSISSEGKYLVVYEVEGKTVCYDLSAGPDGNGKLNKLSTANLSGPSFDVKGNQMLSLNVQSGYSEWQAFKLPQLTPVKSYKATTDFVIHSVIDDVHLVSTGYIEIVE